VDASITIHLVHLVQAYLSAERCEKNGKNEKMRDLHAHYRNLFGRQRWWRNPANRFAIAAGAQTGGLAGGALYGVYKYGEGK